MNGVQGKEFLKALRAKNISEKGTTMLVASCPLARWKHTSKQDKNPSFGLFVKDGERSHYHCFTCGSGSAEDLIGAMELYLPKDERGDYDWKTARAMLDDELAVTPLPEFTEFNQPTKVFRPWPEWWLESFVSAWYSDRAKDYLKARNVPEQQWEEFDLRYDSSRDMVVHPYWTVYGQFAGARGRGISSEAESFLKHHDYTYDGSNNAKMVWYNEPALDLPGWVTVVEGQYDVLRVVQKWKKTVGNLTAIPTEEKFKKLTASDGIVLIPDPDAAGEASKIKYRELAAKYKVPLKVFDIPQGDDGKKVDPDLCHPDFLYESIVETIEGKS